MVRLLSGVLALAITMIGYVSAVTQVSDTMLVLITDPSVLYTATSAFNGYGIPYQVVYVPQYGATLPALNSTATTGNFAGILVMSEVSYDYGNGNWSSALSTSQWQTLYNYQTSFNVRMVRIDAYPQPEFSTTTAIASTGCCGSTVEQNMTFTNATGLATANLKLNTPLSTLGLWHYPATITDPTTAWQVAGFGPSQDGQFTASSSAAVYNRFGNREQQVWFISWANDWSRTSNYFNHVYISFLTRGVFVGRRRIYFTNQIDDMHLISEMYNYSTTANFRVTAPDMTNIVTWQANYNTRLPAGSKYFLDIGHNGNGNIDNATNRDSTICNPDSAVYPNDPGNTALEFQKPIGTGSNMWPSTPTSYQWTKACSKTDPLNAWFQIASNLNSFSHISHTFTHLDLDNSTYSDTVKEIQFNQAWAKTVGVSAATQWSNGLIPPAITGLHNGDAIRAWMSNGVKAVVGDNSRPPLLNAVSEFWPLISNVANNGYAGLVIMGRWSNAIYYNCDTPLCTLTEWVNTSGGWGAFPDLLEYEMTTTTRNMLKLRQDPYMFHQANLHNVGMPKYSVGSVSGNWGLLQIWAETVMAEFQRLTNWPITSLKHDDIATQMTNRMTLDSCKPNAMLQYSADGSHITGALVTTTGNKCAAPVPITFPGTATANVATTVDLIGSEPPTYWVTMTGSPVTFTLATPVALL